MKLFGEGFVESVLWLDRTPAIHSVVDWYQDWERGDTECGSAQEAWFCSSVTSGWCFSKGEPDGWPQQHHHPHGSL